MKDFRNLFFSIGPVDGWDSSEVLWIKNFCFKNSNIFLLFVPYLLLLTILRENEVIIKGVKSCFTQDLWQTENAVQSETHTFYTRLISTEGDYYGNTIKADEP